MDNLLRSICEQLEIPYSGYKALTGGDINTVFLVQSGSDRWVFKLNHAQRYPGMFQAEAKGLELLQKSNSFQIPKVKATGEFQNQAYLVLEYIPKGATSSKFWEIFAKEIALLHQTTQDYFGLDHDNYIGSLPQYNSHREKASEFYIEQRLEPQFKIARDLGFSFQLGALYKNLESEIPGESPSLVHGDLWNGNYLIHEMGTPVLIDPAVAFAPREMDIGMMHLFGGFPEKVFSIYDELLPMPPDWKERIPIWQLYYLLVHVNLFGRSYYGQVKRIIDHFS